MDKAIKPINCLRGEITVPGDKSISHRAVFTGSIAKGVTVAENFLEADDCLRTVRCFRAMGIERRRIMMEWLPIAGVAIPIESGADRLLISDVEILANLIDDLLVGRRHGRILTDQMASLMP